jgi:hypothetical protein
LSGYLPRRFDLVHGQEEEDFVQKRQIAQFQVSLHFPSRQNRRPSTGQKQKISTVLENVATGTASATSTALVPRENLPVTTYAVGLPNNTSSAGSGAKVTT